MFLICPILYICFTSGDMCTCFFKSKCPNSFFVTNPVFCSVVYFSRGPLPQKRVKGHYSGDLEYPRPQRSPPAVGFSPAPCRPWAAWPRRPRCRSRALPAAAAAAPETRRRIAAPPGGSLGVFAERSNFLGWVWLGLLWSPRVPFDTLCGLVGSVSDLWLWVKTVWDPILG